MTTSHIAARYYVMSMRYVKDESTTDSETEDDSHSQNGGKTIKGVKNGRISRKGIEELVVVRTDPKVAKEDVHLIQSIFHRKAWIREVIRGPL